MQPISKVKKKAVICANHFWTEQLSEDSMNRAWAMFRSYSYITNVVGYTTLFATADVIQQSMLGGAQDRHVYFTGDTSDRKTSTTHRVQVSRPSEDAPLKDSECSQHVPEEQAVPVAVNRAHSHSMDWAQTARVALVGLCFHSNFNYHWLRALERMFPGGGAKKVTMKVFLDQLIAAPATISAFYIGLSTLEGREDPFEDWKNKFWTSYKTGIVYWSTMQAVNFSLVPPVARTVFVGGISLGWTVFLCHFRQQTNESHVHFFTSRTP
ncbi:mpv17-like protein [Brachyhypopomus gauderio]|uniref:mpv17-like protein n=1 Tax=Brachyhypopomus gauderio TaxID=698409 RepID=UPI004041E30E